MLFRSEEALRLHKTRRAGDLTRRSAALEELAGALDLPEAPLRIECYDISHTHGAHQVGSMVVFEDGAPRKSDYRRFTVGLDVQALHAPGLECLCHEQELGGRVDGGAAGRRGEPGRSDLDGEEPPAVHPPGRQVGGVPHDAASGELRIIKNLKMRELAQIGRAHV